MASTIILKKSTTPNAVPAVGDLEQGELAVNLADNALFTKDRTDAIVRLNGGAVIVGHAVAHIAGGNLVIAAGVIGGMTISRSAEGQFSIDMPGNIKNSDLVSIRVQGNRINWYEVSHGANDIQIEVRDNENIANALTDPEKIIVTVAR